MNKRCYQRFEVDNVVANLSDGVNSISATVCDVSRVGLMLADVPQELKKLGDKLSITVSAEGKDYKMLVVPKWIHGDTSGKKMGLAILDDPLDWNMFVVNYKPEKEDVWAATTNLPDY